MNKNYFVFHASKSIYKNAPSLAFLILGFAKRPRFWIILSFAKLDKCFVAYFVSHNFQKKTRKPNYCGRGEQASGKWQLFQADSNLRQLERTPDSSSQLKTARANSRQLEPTQANTDFKCSWRSASKNSCSEHVLPQTGFF